MKQYKTVEILRPFERNGSFPIDNTSVFFSYESAVRYAHEDQSAYPGQIISVIDEVHQKTSIYKLDFDKDKHFKLVLEPITVGTSSTGGFRLVGVVNYYADLPLVSDNGDMYLVTEKNKFYVAIEISEDEMVWRAVEMDVDLVTEVRDGIFKHEIYSTLINSSTKNGVYFSSGDGNPENNKWLEVESTSVEQERGSFTMLSIGRVKQIVSTMTNTSKPHIEILSETPRDNYVLSVIRPTLSIVYYPELGGNLHKITVYNSDGVAVLETYPEPKDLVVSADGKSYTYTFNSDFLSSEIRKSYVFRAVVDYDQSDDGNMPAGSCENSIQFNFYQPVIYGTNLNSERAYMKDGDNIIELEYHPENYDALMDNISIRIPNSHYLKSVTFVNQNDLFAKSLFGDPQILADVKVYLYSVTIGFKSPGKFIFYISEESGQSEQ